MTPLDLALAADSERRTETGPIFGFWRDLAGLGQPRGVEKTSDCDRIARHWRARGLRWADELDGATPLQLACLVSRPEMIRALISLGANPSHFNESGVSALACSIELGQPLCAQTLMESGARLDRIRKSESPALPSSAPLAFAIAGMRGLETRARTLLSAQLEHERLEEATSTIAVKAPRTPKGL